MGCRILMNIYDRKNEVRRKIYSEMLKKRQRKSSTRLCDGVIVREWMQNKNHHHVHESRTFSKRSTWYKEMLTPSNRALTERRHELIPRHNSQTLTTRIGMRIPRMRVKKRGAERSISCMYVRVELLDKHERTCDRDITQ